jgi:superfamily II DNA/RNA helicase
LVERFRDDPACRVFLSTDAGSTGLNLQHASTVVNMDLPWNPAILEQRIARIHRMGQRRPVQVVNFVAKGTIEEGMLSVLAFKRSLAAGILDGGTSEISLGGSRLNRFMKDVESVTGSMGDGAAVSADEELTPKPASVTPTTQDSEADTALQSHAPSQLPSMAVETALQPLWQMGVQLISALAAASQADAEHPWIERDPHNGARSLKLPLPEPQLAAPLADALSALAGMLRGKV